MKRARSLALLACLPGMAVAAEATDLRLHLNGGQPIRQTLVLYACDARGVQMGLPAGEFLVRYVNGAGNSLAVVPVHGVDTVFANVISADGARYAAGSSIWWQARETTFSSATADDGLRSVCREVKVGAGRR